MRTDFGIYLSSFFLVAHFHTFCSYQKPICQDLDMVDSQGRKDGGPVASILDTDLYVGREDISANRNASYSFFYTSAEIDNATGHIASLS